MVGFFKKKEIEECLGYLILFLFLMVLFRDNRIK